MENMDNGRVFGGGSSHLEKRIYSRLPCPRDVLTLHRSSGTTPTSSRCTTWYTKCRIHRRTREAPVTSKLLSSRTSHVTECRSLLFWPLPPVSCTSGFLHIRLRLSALVTFVALLLLVLTVYVPDVQIFRLRTIPPVRVLPGNARQPIFSLASAADDFPGGRSGINSPAFLFENGVQNSSSSFPRVPGSPVQGTASVPQIHSPSSQYVEISITHQNGRRLAASNPQASDDVVSKDTPDTPPAPGLPALESRVDGPAIPPHRRESAPSVSIGSIPHVEGGDISPCLYLSPDGDTSSSVSRTRRCASFSNLPPRPKGQTSPSHYPVPFRGHSHPHRRVRNPLPWDIRKPVSPPVPAHLQKTIFPREPASSEAAPQSHALLHDKPSSVGEALWSDVSATERSAFDEMEAEKPKTSSVGKASGSRAWARPDTWPPGDDEHPGFPRHRTTSLTDDGSPRSMRRTRSSPGPKKRRSVDPDGEYRRALGRSSPKRPSVEGLFPPSSHQPSSAEEASGSSTVPGTAQGAPASGVGNLAPAGAAPGSRHASETSLPTAEEADKRKKPYTAGDSQSRSFDEDASVASEPTIHDAESGDDGSEIASLGDSPRSSRSSIGQSDDDSSDVSPAESRPSTPGEDPGGGDRNACPANMINLMFDVYYSYLVQDARLRRQFALLVLSSIQWPLYTDSTSWRRPQLQKWLSQLTELANETLAREPDYSYSSILLDEMRELGWIIRSVNDLQRFLRAQSRVDLHLRHMLSYVPEHRLAISLKPELLVEVYNATAQLQFIYYYSSAMDNPEASSLLQWKFIREVHLRWSMLQLLGITHQLITRKPLSGVLILQVDKIDTKEKEVLRLFDAEENKTTQEALMKFETTVTDALTRRIKMVAKHFQKIFSASDLNYGRGFQLPKCQVTAFYLKPEGGKRETSSLGQPVENTNGSTDADGGLSATSEAIETGLFGFEIDVNIAKELKDRLPRGSMYIQLSLVDGWDYQPVYKPPTEDPNIIPAHRATQILKANLEHDPSLFRVGMTKVIYSTILDAYNTSAPDQTGYDNDRHLVLRVPLSEFKSEEHFLASIVAMVSVPSIHNAAPRTVNPHRIKVMGSARRLTQGEVLKTGNFLSCIDYRRHKSIEAMVEPNTVAVHIFLEGIKEKSVNSVFELEASTIFDRLLRRGRSKFTVMHAELVPKKTGAGGQGKAATARAGGYPAWVLVVSNLCVAAFFLVVLVSLLLNRHAKLPWWIACICGPQNPFAPESENRRDSVAEHADPITSISDRRAMFFARSRSMLVSGLGGRKLDKWEADQQTKSTDDGADGADSGSEHHPPVSCSRHSSLLRQGSKRRSFAAAVAPLSRKGSLFFGGMGRGVQGRQQTRQLAYVSADELDSSADGPPVSNTVPTLSALPAASMDRSTSAGSSFRGVRSSSVCTQDRSMRDARGSTGGSYHHRDRSLPSGERRGTGRNGMPQSISGSTSSPAPLRTLELAKSYRRGRRPPSQIAQAPHQLVQGSGKRGSVSFKRGNAVYPVARNRDETTMQRRKARRVEEGKPRRILSDNAGEDINDTLPGVRSVGSRSLGSPPPVAVDEFCRVTPPSADAYGPGGVV